MWPVMLQKHDHMSEGQVVTVVSKSTELIGQNETQGGFNIK